MRNLVNDVGMAGAKNLWPGTRVTRPACDPVSVLRVFMEY